ncbi:MAG TPA: DUF4149 domain-containing protein [Planctomycetota bacterium]|nr:DUF4149 domain-containing protein [Planctomycetota bacterium]
MIRAGYAVYFLALALWVGGLAALSLVAAPVVFKTAPSRPVAGEIFGSVLRAFGYVEMACAAVLAVSSVVLGLRSPEEGWVKGVRLALVGLMLLLLVTYALGVHPAIAQERARIPNFAALGEGDPARARFDRLHRWSVRLVGANLLIGAALLVFSAAVLKPAR